MLSDSALRRRLKRKFNRSVQQFFIPCTPGMESTLLAEVKDVLPSVGSPSTTSSATHGGVALSSHLHAMYYCNLWLRTANRVLLRIDNFWADSLPAFYSHASRVPWEAYLGFAERVAIRTSSTKSRLSTGDALERSLLAAINACMRNLRAHVDLAPSSSSEIGVPTIHIRIIRDRVTLSIDTSGPHLFKRGYRSPGAPAPLRPTLAAGMLLESGWNMRRPLIDPFCGSGTVAVEAMMVAEDLAPGARRQFAFEQLPFHNDSLWERLRTGATSGPAGPVKPRIFASDIDPEAIDLTERNAAAANPAHSITIGQQDALTLSPTDLGCDGPGWIVSNLPYGKRVPTEGHPSLLAVETLRQWKTRFSGWHVTIATLRSTTEWHTVLDNSRTIASMNGGIPIDIVIGVL